MKQGLSLCGCDTLDNVQAKWCTGLLSAADGAIICGKEVALRINALFWDIFLQDNPHKLTLSMSPEEDYHDKKAKMETEKLEKKVNALSEEEKTEIFEKG